MKNGPKPLPSSSDSSIADILEKEIPGVTDDAKGMAGSKPIDIAESGPTCCHETLVRKNSKDLSSFSLGDSGFGFVSRLSGSVNPLDPDDKCHIVLKQLQRVSEDAVRCLLSVRFVLLYIDFQAQKSTALNTELLANFYIEFLNSFHTLTKLFNRLISLQCIGQSHPLFFLFTAAYMQAGFAYWESETFTYFSAIIVAFYPLKTSQQKY